MPQVFIDPDELEAFLNRLLSFNEEVINATQLLRVSLTKLGETWRDQEYVKFMNAYEHTEAVLMRFTKQVEEALPKIRADIEFIRGYLQH